MFYSRTHPNKLKHSTPKNQNTSRMSDTIPCPNFAELAVRIHNDLYYCHPKYIDLHSRADKIIDIYLNWKNTRDNNLSVELQSKIDVWLKIFDSVKSKKKKEKVKIRDICGICQDKICSGESVRRCGSHEKAHVFHESCMVDFIVHEKETEYNTCVSCPTCRQPLDFEYTKDLQAV